MSPSTLRIWRYLSDYHRERQNAPTIREIAQGCAVSTTAVQRQLAFLEAWGIVRRYERIPRGIVLLKQPPESV